MRLQLIRSWLFFVFFACLSAPAAAQYRDDFEDEALGALPSHWMESDAEEHWRAAPRHWRVVAAAGHPGDHVLLADQYEGERKAMLHTFGSNVELSADFHVVRHNTKPGSHLRFLVRHNSEHDRVELTYEFATRRWELRERTGIVKLGPGDKLFNNPSRMLALTYSALRDGWNHIEIKLVQTQLIAELNGQELLTGVKLEHLNYGRAGFEVHYADVMFDNVSYVGDGEGRVHDGVKEIGGMHDEIYSDIFVSVNGLLTVKSNPNPWGLLESADDGESWRFRSNAGIDIRDLNQVLVFDNKRVLDISGRGAPQGGWFYEAAVTSDGGHTWGPDVRLPRDAAPVYMEPGRLQRGGRGRIFFPIDYGRRQGSQLYYSDDEGQHWQAGAAFTPATLPETFKKVKRFEAPHVVSCGGDRLSTFFRTNRDFHYLTTSEDNGETWSEPTPIFTLRSSLSDASFGFDPSDNSLYAVWLYELQRDPPGCHSEGQWPRERMVLTRSTDCGATWSYLMDLDNWEGNDARWNQMVMRVIGDYIWISADAHVAAAPGCSGASYRQHAKDPSKHFDWRRLYRVDKRKLVPLPHMPLLQTR